MRQLLIERSQLHAKCEAILNKAKAEKRDLTPAENAETELLISQMQAVNAQIQERVNIQNGGAIPEDFMSMIPSNARPAGQPKPSFQPGRQSFAWPGLSDFIKDPTSNGVRASLTEGGDLQNVLPGHVVAQFLAAYPGTDPLTAAGCSIQQLDSTWTDGIQPIITAGTAPSIFTEGTGPSSDESAKVFALALDSPKKIGFLSLPSEESVWDVPSLASTIGAEGIARLLQGRTKRVTDDLLTTLNSAGAVVTGDDDNYHSLLAAIASIPPRFSGNNVCWMMSRTTRTALLNTRDGNDRPILSADMTQLLGVRIVLNDYIPFQKCLYGDFGSGVFVRSAAMAVQRMEEAYKENGAVGFRFIQRSDWGFFSTAANASQAEQPVILLSPVDAGS